MQTQAARWATAGILLIGAALAYAGCGSLYDEYVKPLKETGSGGAGGGCAAECCAPDDCPTPSNACIARTCEPGGTCGTKDVEDGTPTDLPTEACKVVVCDGNGGTRVENDDDGVYDDGKDCTVDSCSGGMPLAMAAMLGTPCDDDDGAVCNDAAACVQCNVNGDCTTSEKLICIASTCVDATCMDTMTNGSETDQDCGGDCKKCDDLKTCKIANDCKSGVCKADSGELKCQVPACDDAVKNGSETDLDCGGAACAKCGPDKGCNENGDCAGNQCTGSNGTCVPNCSDGSKNNAETDVDCGGGSCNGCPAGKACAGQDTDCGMTTYCNGTTCVQKKDIGAACAGNNQCSNGFCVDGTCCSNACNGTCQTCSAQGACLLIAAGSDPDNECPGTDACNGDGVCGKPVGGSCLANADCANGQCADGVCCVVACNNTCKACSMALTGQANGTCANISTGLDPHNECAGATTCNGNAACALFADGAACTFADGSECLNGNCVDGYCCGTQCTGSCKACSMMKTGQPNGMCALVTNQTDPDNECSGNSGSDVCDGAGTCKKANGTACSGAGLNTTCASLICKDGVCCNTTCLGICQACDLAGNLGTCLNVPDGQDPDTECSGAMNCNGMGACQ